MTALKRFATNRPIIFGCLVVLVFVVFIILAGVLTYPMPGGPGAETVAAGTKLVGAAVLLLLLWRLGWLRAAGITYRGGWRPWLFVLPAMVYSLIAVQYAFFGGIDFDLPDPTHAASVALNMIVDGGLQEIVFRGVLLYALVRVWADTKRGVIMSVLISSVLFGGLHILNLFVAGRALSVALLQIADTVISGTYYAALVLYGQSIWPVVLWHGLLNAIVSVRAISTPGFEETVSMWTLFVLSNLPLLIYGAYLLYRLRPRPVVPDAA